MLQTISLTAMRKAVGRVELDGVEYEVYNIPGTGYEVITNLISSIRDFQELPEDQRTPDQFPNVAELYEAAASCVPSMPKNVVMSLTPEMVSVIIRIASGNVEKVEALVQKVLEKNGNASGEAKVGASARNGRLKASRRSTR